MTGEHRVMEDRTQVSSEAVGPLGLRVGQRARRTQRVTRELEGECWTYTLQPS